MKIVFVFFGALIISWQTHANDCAKDLSALTTKRNALIRVQVLDKYPNWVFKSTSRPNTYIVLFRETTITAENSESVIEQSQALGSELNEFDGIVIQSKKLSFTGNSPFVDSQSGGLKTSWPLLDIIEGLTRLTPLATLLISPHFFGPHPLENVNFWLINGTVYFASQLIFPELMTHVSKHEQETYLRTGHMSKGIYKRTMGSIFDKFQRKRIQDELIQTINTRINTAPSDSPTVIAVIATPDMATYLSLKFNKEKTFYPLYLDKEDPLHIAQ